MSKYRVDISARLGRMATRQARPFRFGFANSTSASWSGWSRKRRRSARTSCSSRPPSTRSSPGAPCFQSVPWPETFARLDVMKYQACSFWDERWTVSAEIERPTRTRFAESTVLGGVAPSCVSRGPCWKPAQAAAAAGSDAGRPQRRRRSERNLARSRRSRSRSAGSLALSSRQAR